MSDERWKEKYYDKIAELNIAESRASQFESTLTETMKERDELKDWGLVRQKAFAEQAEAVEKVIKERDKLKAALAEAEETIHDEFCGSKGCHPLHLKVKQLSR